MQIVIKIWENFFQIQCSMNFEKTFLYCVVYSIEFFQLQHWKTQFQVCILLKDKHIFKFSGDTLLYFKMVFDISKWQKDSLEILGSTLSGIYAMLLVCVYIGKKDVNKSMISSHNDNILVLTYIFLQNSIFIYWIGKISWFEWIFGEARIFCIFIFNEQCLLHLHNGLYKKSPKVHF